MVRLTADLILRSPQYFNAVKERELDLRGNKIAVIENVGATEDQFDSIDLSDNEIVKLEGFPLLRRLSTLLVNNNRIARLHANLGASLPKLSTLVLTTNKLVNLSDLDPLSTLPKLQTLSLLDNEVTKKPQYRLYVIHRCPNLRLLDFKKIKQKERIEAQKAFGGTAEEQAAKKEAAKTFVPGEGIEAEGAEKKEEPKKVGPTPEQITAIKAAIATAQTLEEVSRLEKALRSGQLPNDILVAEDSSAKTTDRMEEG
jgi:U2 small nuclear ribonucleoprotein A'